MRIVVAPDKFKGSLAATEVAAAVAAGLRAELPGADLVTVPVADGGDGTVDAAVAAGFERVPVTAAGPAGPADPGGGPGWTSYARRGDVAVVELACVCGLSRLRDGRTGPLTASSFGAGEVLRAALDAGARRIVLAVGGSASTDGGAGLLQALGARVLDGRGQPVQPGGAALRDVASLDLAGLHPALRSAAITVAADVDNPLTGPAGAAEVYGPQKGATPAEVAVLAAGLRRWATVVAATTGIDRSRAPGSGAAGGVGFAGLAVLGARRRPGIDLVLDLVGFDAVLGPPADPCGPGGPRGPGPADGRTALVITGEGSLDRQSLAGKAPLGVARAAVRRGIPVVAVAGRAALTAGELAAAGITAVYPLTDLEPDPAACMAGAARLLRRAGRMIARERVHHERIRRPGRPVPEEVRT